MLCNRFQTLDLSRFPRPPSPLVSWFLTLVAGTQNLLPYSLVILASLLPVLTHKLRIESAPTQETLTQRIAV